MSSKSLYRTAWRTGLIFALLIAAALLPATVTTAQGQQSVAPFKPITWNMQGGAGLKWSQQIKRFLEGWNQPAHEVVTVQEAGPEQRIVDMAYNGAPSRTFQQGNLEVHEYIVNFRTGDRPTVGYVYFMVTDPQGNRVNLATVTRQAATQVHFIQGQPDAHGGGQGRPSFGVELHRNGDTAVFWNIHALSYGEQNNINDAENQLLAIGDHMQQTLPNATWAVMGDFNRAPSLLDLDYVAHNLGFHLYRYNPGRTTQQNGGELDYMVTNEALPAGWRARAQGITQSDHYAVGFQFRAGGEKSSIRLSENPDLCIKANSKNEAATGDCTSGQIVDFVFDEGKIQTVDTKGNLSGNCFNIKGGGEQQEITQVILWGCNNDWNEKFDVRPDGSIYNPGPGSGANGRCLEQLHNSIYASPCVESGERQRFVLSWAGQATQGSSNTGCMTSPSGSTLNSTKIIFQTCKDAAYDQFWTAGPKDTVRYEGKCLDVQGNNTRENSDLILWDCNGQGNQRWITQDNGTVQNPQSGLCLDIGDPILIIAKCDGGKAAQQWTIPSLS